MSEDWVLAAFRFVVWGHRLPISWGRSGIHPIKDVIRMRTMGQRIVPGDLLALRRWRYSFHACRCLLGRRLAFG